MKKTGWIILILIAAGLITGLAYYLVNIANKPPIYIAIMVPGEETGANATRRSITSIQMYLDEVNARGGINGRPLKIIIKEDGGTVGGAEKSLNELNIENQAMLILGNVYSDPASAIAPKLTELKIPAITAGATAPQVTINNPWFFRVVPNNTAQGDSIAAYAVNVLEHRSAAIIYENNQYGETLGKGFENTFSKLGGEVVLKASIDASSKTLEQDAVNIVKQFYEIPDMIFLATYKSSGAAAVVALHDQNIRVPLIGGDDIGDPAFLNSFSNEIKQNMQYTNGIYAASPLIFDVASDEAQLFRETYINRLKENPTWFSATSYDSALMAVQAMRDANISNNPSQLNIDRQKVRDQLAKYNAPQRAVQGITGNLYFDKNNDVVKPVAMGVFANQQFISAPIQIQPILNNDQVDNFTDARLRGELFYIDGRPVYKTKIVYVGADINEFSQIDIDDEHTFTADFYLWFRYIGDLDIENIAFDNAVNPVELELIRKAQFEEVTYTLYRTKAKFSGSYDLLKYPFDHHKLSISFRHPDYDRYKVIFVADLIGMGDINKTETILSALEQSRAFEGITDWMPVTGSYFQDIIHEYTNRGDPTLFGQKLDIQYSRFNITVEVRRDVLRFITKTMLPVLFLITLAYLGFFLPGNQFETITGLMTGTLLSVVFFHVDLSSRLRVGYTVVQDYIFYLIYGMLTVELFLSIIAWHKKEKTNTVKKLFWIMRIIYPLILILGTAALLWAFEINTQELFGN